jgi:hypothetical protein
LCLEDLKLVRGMKQQGKTHRVALSFRLWGDPELPALGPRAQRPHGKPVAAHWSAPGELTIHVPARRLPEVRSISYYARMFPDSLAAGLVRKRKDAAMSRVVAAYYFRVSLPEGFDRTATRLSVSTGGLNQAAFRLDPLGRFLYVIYLPDVEHANETIVLRWGTAGVGRKGNGVP